MLLLYFYLSGRLGAYLVPMYRPGVGLSGAVMLSMAAWQSYGVFFPPRRGLAAPTFAEDEVGAPRRVWATQFLAFVLLIVPVWAAGVSGDRFSVSAVLNRGVAQDAATLPGRAAGRAPAPPASLPAASAEDAAPYFKQTADGHLIVEVTDLLFSAEDDTMRPVFENRTVEIVGQFLPVKDSSDHRMLLVRLLMVCCAADAKPAGIVLLPPPDQAAEVGKLAEMSWIKVVGEVDYPQENGRSMPVLRAQSVVRCDAPKETMLY